MRPQTGGSFGRYTDKRDNRLPSDRQMEAWRLAGKFTCQCSVPAPFQLGAFGATECHQCWKPIYPPMVHELIAAVLEEAGQ